MSIWSIAERAVTTILSTQLRGVSRVRSIFRGAWPTSLWERKIAFNLTVGLDLDTGYIDKCVAKDAFYELEVAETILSCARNTEDFVFWDIGANFGLMSLAVKKCIPSSTVVAFEPHPLMASRLMQNAIKNECEIAVFSLGLGATDCIASLYVNMVGNAGLNSIKPWPNIKYDTNVNVGIRRAESLFLETDLAVPNCIKIDVESFEIDVLVGFGNVLANTELKYIIFEASDQIRYNEIANVLTPNGFKIRCLTSSADEFGPNWLASRDGASP